MPTTTTVTFYDGVPTDHGFPTSSSGTFVYTGPATADGTATINDPGSGIDGQTLEDDGGEDSNREDARADVTIGGDTSTNSRVDAERAWLIRDNVTGEEFNVVEFDVEQGDAAGNYTLSEIPLVAGRSYTVLDYDSNPNASSGDPVFTYSEFVCFTRDTMITTSQGERPVQDLKVGDLVRTIDNGLQPIRWIGKRAMDSIDLAMNPKLRPVRIAAGALGRGQPTTDLTVSRQHRVLVRSVIAERMFGQTEVLIPAVKLVALPGIDIVDSDAAVEYWHILFDKHEVIWSNGAPTESLFTGPEALKAVGPQARKEIEMLFPEITRPEFHPVPARFLPDKGPMIRNLMARHLKNDKPMV